MAEFESRLEATLSEVSGAGETQVLLTLANTGRRVLAQNVEQDGQTHNQSDTLVVAGSDRSETVVELGRVTPEFQGALIVCDGGDSPQVRLSVMTAVSVLTGLGADQISICKGD